MVVNPIPSSSSPLPEEEAQIRQELICENVFGASINKKETNTLRLGFQNIGGFPLGKKTQGRQYKTRHNYLRI
jgi:hypothetical protein